jgi:hypothetical protein
VATPQGGFNWNTVLLEDFLEAAEAMTPQELVGALRDMREQTGLSLPLVASILGSVQIQVTDSNGVEHAVEGDQNGMLFAGPPSKHVRQVGASGSAAVATLSDLGANHRNVVMAFGITIACGANALAPASATLSGLQGPSSITIQLACPANDIRTVLAQGPFVSGPTGFSAISLTLPALPVGALGSCWLAGYDAAIP